MHAANHLRRHGWLALLAALAPVATAAQADTGARLTSQLSAWHAEPLSDQELGRFRGGFNLRDGITIALGIADMIRIDG